MLKTHTDKEALFGEVLDADPSTYFFLYLDGSKLPPGLDAFVTVPAGTPEGSLRMILDASEQDGLTLVPLAEVAVPIVEALAPYLKRAPVLLTGLESEPSSRIFSSAITKLGSIALHDLLASDVIQGRVQKTETTERRRRLPRGRLQEDRSEEQADKFAPVNDQGSEEEATE